MLVCKKLNVKRFTHSDPIQSWFTQIKNQFVFPFQVEFTFDKTIMIDNLVICRDILLQLVEKHLTPKSLDRIRHVFNHYADPDLLTNLYNAEGPLWPNLTKICGGLNKLIEEGKLWNTGPSLRNLTILTVTAQGWTRKQGVGAWVQETTTFTP